ncbi:MAG TPA: hypothetical protein VKS22_10025 [Candidatus Binataceae bacterium]|nr:hypothetical protein [Candidatus Binataceae bacterium]
MRGIGFRAQGSSGRRKTGGCLPLFMAACAMTLAAIIPALAQPSAAPKTLPETTIAPEDSAPSAAVPAAADEGVPTAPLPAVPVSHTPRAVHHAAKKSVRKTSVAWSGAVEPADAMLKLKESSWAYTSPADSSSRIERMDPGKFVHVTGATHYFVQVKLKSGAVGYVPVSAVELDRPTDKMFKLTKDTPVLSEPNRYGKKLAEVHNTHDVHVIGTSLNYMKIRMKDGLEGYIAMTALE